MPDEVMARGRAFGVIPRLFLGEKFISVFFSAKQFHRLDGVMFVANSHCYVANCCAWFSFDMRRSLTTETR